MIERNTVAQRYGSPVRVPEAVLEASEAVREGRTTAERANRALGTATGNPGRPPKSPTRPTATSGPDDARRDALRGARERLRRFREGR